MPHLHAVLRFHLVTQDLPRLAAFYADALGFRADGPPRPIPPAEMALLGLAGGGERQLLRLGAQCVALDRFEHPGRPYPADADAAALVFQHLALATTDIAAAHARLGDAAPISRGGPQQLPPASGGVRAWKFRDPDGHPLELLQFPAEHAPPAWAGADALLPGIDHSAISVRDTDASRAFYAPLGLSPGQATHNHGPEQDRLDGLARSTPTVTPLRPDSAPPHLELLCYPDPAPTLPPAPNDVAATRISWRADADALLRDPDGHLHQLHTA